MLFRKRKYETYGEGGLYEGVNEAVTSKIYSMKGCRIHISQNEHQQVTVDIMNEDKMVKRLEVKGDKWIKIKGEGKYWLKAYNNETKSLRVGMSIRSLE